LAACFIDPGVQVVPDLDQPGALSRIGAQQGTAEAGVLVDAGCAERPAACPERNFPSLEVAEELRNQSGPRLGGLGARASWVWVSDPPRQLMSWSGLPVSR